MKTKDSRIKRRGTPASKSDRPDWGWSKNGKPNPAILADVIEAVVRAAKPAKIVLFGSAARGEMGPESDFDLLVIKGGKFNYWRTYDTITEHLRRKRAPVDVVLVTAEDAERYRDTHCLVICPALKEGRVVYAAKAPATGRPRRMAQSGTQQPGVREGARPRRVC